LIGISGKIGSGKSTLTNLLIDYFKMYNIDCEEKSFASKLKEITKIITGYGGYTQEEKNIYLDEYNFTVGEALQKIGTSLRNDFHKNIWVITTLQSFCCDKIFIISDVRYCNEADLIREKGGILIRLEGDPAEVRKNSKRDLNHTSETDLDDYPNFDFIFDNSGFKYELSNFAKTFVDFIIKLINNDREKIS